MKLDEISESFDRATALTRAGKLDDAEAIYRSLIEYLQTKNGSICRDEFSELLISARVGLAGVFFRAKKNFDEAIELCSACVEQDASDSKAFLRRAELWQELAHLGRPGAFGNARADISEVIRLEPKNKRAKQLQEEVEIVAEFIEQGFPGDLSLTALKACKGNKGMALEWLLNKTRTD